MDLRYIYSRILLKYFISKLIHNLLVLEVGQVQNEGPRSLKFPSQKIPDDKHEYSKPNWLTDSVELDFNTWIIENVQECKYYITCYIK